MKHIKSFKTFKNTQKSYFQQGFTTEKSLIECILPNDQMIIREGFSLKRLDADIIDSIYSGVFHSEHVLNEKLGGIFKKISKNLSFKKVWDNPITKDIKIGDFVANTIKDLFSKITNIVGTLIEKIKNVLSKIWENFKPKIKPALDNIQTAIKTGTTMSLEILTKLLKDGETIKEFTELNKDINVIEKYKTGKIGWMSEQTQKKLADEASQYKGVQGKEEIEKLMSEGLSGKNLVKKLYYSIKGYLLTEGKITDLYEVVNEKFNEGDKVMYRNEKGNVIKAEVVSKSEDGVKIKKEDGEELTIDPKRLYRDEKKGVLGWLYEAVGYIFTPQRKIAEIVVKHGYNGILKGVSLLNRGIDKFYNYMCLGIVASAVYFLIRGSTKLVFGGGGSVGDSGVMAGRIAKLGIKTAHSMSNKKGEEEKTDLTSPSKWTSFLENYKEILLPIAGSTLMTVLAVFLPTIRLGLEVILISLGVVQLFSEACKLEKFKDTQVCKLGLNLQTIIN